MKYKIAVSGAAEIGHCEKMVERKAEEVGKEIIRHNGILITGATTGVPYYAAKGAKKVNGIVIGVSPAASEKSHLRKYRLPIDNHDLIIYTGFEYAGRNLFLCRCADGVIIICGRIGTLNEFTISFEEKKPIGILTNTGGTADIIKEIVENSHRGPGKIVYDSDPKRLVKKLTKLIDKERNSAQK